MTEIADKAVALRKVMLLHHLSSQRELIQPMAELLLAMAEQIDPGITEDHVECGCCTLGHPPDPKVWMDERSPHGGYTGRLVRR